MKEYKSLLLTSFTAKKDLDKYMEELVNEGYQLIPVTFRGNIMVFEKEKKWIPPLNPIIKQPEVTLD